MSKDTASLGKGYIHIYTGNGKGKTSAALGLALRAAGSGCRTCIVQFMKGQHYGELEAAVLLGGLVTIEQYGHPEFCRISQTPDPGDVEGAHDALSRVHELMGSGACDILVADEIITSVLFKLVGEQDVLDVMARKPEGLELVLTGRGATQPMIDAADLVTEMKEVKHYYARGVNARKGIES